MNNISLYKSIINTTSFNTIRKYYKVYEINGMSKIKYDSIKIKNRYFKFIYKTRFRNSGFSKVVIWEDDWFSYVKEVNTYQESIRYICNK